MITKCELLLVNAESGGGGGHAARVVVHHLIGTTKVEIARAPYPNKQTRSGADLPGCCCRCSPPANCYRCLIGPQPSEMPTVRQKYVGGQVHGPLRFRSSSQLRLFTGKLGARNPNPRPDVAYNHGVHHYIFILLLVM